MMPDVSKTAVLLGAGASKEAGVPTTFEMTEKLVERINSTGLAASPIAKALHFVCGALLAHDAAAGANPFTTLDVERVFAAVELLGERLTLEVTPFVAAWNPAVDALDTRMSSATGNLSRRFKQALAEPDSMHGVEKAIIELIDARTGSGATGDTYRELARVLLKELRDLVATHPKDTRYLTPLTEVAREGEGLTIATLNYDLAIEQAAASCQMQCATGVERWLGAGGWEWPKTGIRLLKLHGSINWVWERPTQDSGHLPRPVMRIAADPQTETNPPAIVFGARGKLQTEGPFLSLLIELEQLLRTAEQLVVIGYSFRDDHINQVIQRWTLEDRARKIVVVDPGWPERFSYASVSDFRRDLAMHFLPSDSYGSQEFEPRLEIRRQPCSQAVRDLFGGSSTP